MRKTKIFLVAAVSVMVLTLTASCGYWSQFSNRENARQLRVGMNKQEVLELMGEPIRGREYCKPDIWFYYVETRWGWDFQPTRDECMPLLFEEGRLTGWGWDYYRSRILFPDSGSGN